MMNRLSLRYLFVQFSLLVFALSPMSVKAQFKAPSPEELHMTSDAKASDADAVYLDYSYETEDELHVQTVYARIKILTEKGKQYATVELEYPHEFMRVDEIKARTIHPDGTVIPLDGKPEDLVVSKTLKRSGAVTENLKVFNLPSVEVGSIVEYRYKLRLPANSYFPPSWEVQKSLYVHHSHYFFSPFKAFLKNQNAGESTEGFLVNAADMNGAPLDTLSFSYVLPGTTRVLADTQGRYSLDITDVPAEPREEWMPPISSYLYKVEFYYASAKSMKDYWGISGRSWSARVNSFADHHNGIKEIAAGLVTPADTDTERAQKLYNAVQALDNTHFARVRTESEMKTLGIKPAKHAEETWQQKSGSPQDLAMLYLALLHAVKIPAYGMKIVNRSDGIFSSGYMEFNQLTDDVVIAVLGGKDVVLDPGTKDCPFGQLDWRHSAVGGVRQTDGGTTLMATPQQSYKDNTVTRSVDMTLDENGNAQGTFNQVMAGQEALHWRQVAATYDLDELKKRFDVDLRQVVPNGITAHVDHFIGLDTTDSPLIARVNYSGNYATATSKRLVLPAYFFGSHASHPFVSADKRQTLVDLHYAELTQDEIIIHIPAGFKPEGAPANADNAWPGHAQFLLHVKTDDQTLTIARGLLRGFTFVKAEEYQDLHSFYQKVQSADQAQITLVRLAAN
jgi:transglutaminase-like putative cysteine protease